MLRARAAARAYYAVFSIGPLLVLVVGLAGLVFGEERVRQEVGTQLQSFVGVRSAHVIQSMMSAQQCSLLELEVPAPVGASPTHQAQPWSFLVLGPAAGLSAGLLLRYTGLRKALGIYLVVRHFV